MLYQVSWEDTDGDKYEGIELATFEGTTQLSGNGLFVDSCKIEARHKFCVVVQTAYSPRQRPCSVTTHKGMSNSLNLEAVFQQFLTQFVLGKLRLTFERFSDIDLESLELRILQEQDFTRDEVFDYMSHFSSKDGIVRFLALYQYSLNTLEQLRNEYGPANKNHLLKDSRFDQALAFAERKKDQLKQLAIEDSSTSKQVIDKVKSLIAFYL